MTRAMEAVKSGELRVNQAAKEFCVPPSTLKDRILGRVRHGINPGLEPYLTNEEGSSLVSYCSQNGAWEDQARSSSGCKTNCAGKKSTQTLGQLQKRRNGGKVL